MSTITAALSQEQQHAADLKYLLTREGHPYDHDTELDHLVEDLCNGRGQRITNLVCDLYEAKKLKDVLRVKRLAHTPDAMAKLKAERITTPRFEIDVDLLTTPMMAKLIWDMGFGLANEMIVKLARAEETYPNRKVEMFDTAVRLCWDVKGYMVSVFAWNNQAGRLASYVTIPLGTLAMEPEQP